MAPSDVSTGSHTRDAAVQARLAGENPVDYLRRRGYLQDISNEAGLRALFDRETVTAYIGFDPTAASLHVGHQIGIMMLAVLQRFGHRPIALGGGGTALVGDPSGKTSTRVLLTEESIRSNLKSILPQFDRFLDFRGDRFGDNPPALLMNNADWLLELEYIPFLRDIGRHFSVNEMLAAETYKVRVDSGAGLNFVEFNYRIVQAYDFLHLFRTAGLPPANGRIRSVGQHRGRGRSDPAGRVGRGVRARQPAAHHRQWPEDGQERGQLGLAR